MTYCLVDVGNSTTRTALYDGREVRSPKTVETRLGRTPDEWWALWRSIHDSELDASTTVVGISVVPEVTESLQKLAEPYLETPPKFLGPPWSGPVEIGEPDPNEVGPDRYAGAVGLVHHYRSGIVVDFGTATTVDVIDDSGCYQGGFIHPGVRTGMDGLRSNTALLPGITLDSPGKPEPTSTRGALEGGIHYGHAGAVDRMVRELRDWAGLSTDSPVVGTGGYGNNFVDRTETIDHHNPDLVLEGVARLLGGKD